MQMTADTTIKGYEVRERIGTGGFGAVYRAYQTTVGREVAIKVILPGLANRPDFIRRFETEAQLIARLEHLHIVPLHDYWRDPDGAYLVMRYLRGGSLRDAIARGAYDLEMAALLLDQISAGLVAAHRNNIIHRDLKPGNILLDEDGNGYLADFGIAKDLAFTDSGITEPDQFVGSPDYFAPEQARSEPVTPQTDIYSLGVVLYEILAGEHPYPGLKAVERLYKHLNEPIPLIRLLDPKVADAINHVIQKATAKNPIHRYADALELAAAFREAAALSASYAGDRLVEMLTPREQEILQLMITGKSNREIAQALVVELTTVKWHITQIYQKLNVRSRVQAIVRARELNLIVDGWLTNTPITFSRLPEPENPYKGLRAFQPADSQDFFGREALSRKLLARMGEKGEGTRFLAVVGPSGSGKSSIVKAGVIPALWRGELPGSEKWFVIDMMPGARPLDELEVALTRIAADQGANLSDHLHRDQAGLLRAAALILPNDNSELVLVIDQFEEMFTLVEEDAQREQFLSLIHAAVTDPRSRVRVIVTLRADFYDRPLQHPGIAELVQVRTETVLPLSAEELERAIVQPAKRVGVTFEEGLVASIVGEVHYQPGVLPLLQYALTELFEQRAGWTLTHGAYEQIGRSVGALARRAEEIYAEMDEASQEATRQMFMRLVTLGEGGSAAAPVPDTRRRVPRPELLGIAANPDQMDEVIDTYAGYRLLSLDHDPMTHIPTVEVAHEALLREWGRLRDWLNESRSDIRLQRQLGHAAEEWRSDAHDPSYLLRGARLEQFEAWSQSTELALTQTESEYLRASLAMRHQEQTAEATRQAQEVRLERRSQRVLQGLVGVFLIAAIVSSGLALWAMGQRREARREASVGLGAQALLELQGKYPYRAVPLALEALEDYPYTWQAERALGQSVLDSRIELILEGHYDSLMATAWSPDGTRLITTSLDDSAILWNAVTGERLAAFTHNNHGQLDNVMVAAWSPSGDAFATAGGDGRVTVWNAVTGEEKFSVSHNVDYVFLLGWSPDGTRLASFDWNGNTRITDTATGEVIEILGEGTNSIDSYGGWSPDGSQLATPGRSRYATIWDTQTGERVFSLEGHQGTIQGVSWSPNGRWIATASTDGTARVWDATTGDLLHTLAGHTEAVWFARWSPEGDRVATASLDGTSRVWNAATGDLIALYNSGDSVDPAEFDPRLDWSPDGRRIVTAAGMDG